MNNFTTKHIPILPFHKISGIQVEGFSTSITPTPIIIPNPIFQYDDPFNKYNFEISINLIDGELPTELLERPTAVQLTPETSLDFVGIRPRSEFIDLNPNGITEYVRLFQLQTDRSDLQSYSLKICFDIEKEDDIYDFCFVFGELVEIEVSTKKLKRGTVTIVQSSKGDGSDSPERS